MTQRAITNNGLIRWSNGNIGGFGAGFVLNNALSGVVEIRSDKVLGGSFSPLPVINNSGIIRKTSSDGVTNLVAPLNNFGAVDVQSGTLRLSAVQSQTNSGNINVNSGAAIEIVSGVTFNFNQGASVTGGGVVRAEQTALSILMRRFQFPSWKYRAARSTARAWRTFFRFSGSLHRTTPESTMRSLVFQVL